MFAKHTVQFFNLYTATYTFLIVKKTSRKNNNFLLLIHRIAISYHLLLIPFADLKYDNTVRTGKLLLVHQFYLIENVLQYSMTIPNFIHRILQTSAKPIQKFWKLCSHFIIGNVVWKQNHILFFKCRKHVFFWVHHVAIIIMDILKNLLFVIHQTLKKYSRIFRIKFDR